MKDKTNTEERLINLWKEIKESATIKFKDIDKLEEAFNKMFIQIERLTKSRDSWKKKYMEKNESPTA